MGAVDIGPQDVNWTVDDLSATFSLFNYGLVVEGPTQSLLDALVACTSLVKVQTA